MSESDNLKMQVRRGKQEGAAVNGSEVLHCDQNFVPQMFGECNGLRVVISHIPVSVCAEKYLQDLYI